MLLLFSLFQKTTTQKHYGHDRMVVV